MSTLPITVPGPPITLDVSLAQLTAYLERTGWRRTRGPLASADAWHRGRFRLFIVEVTLAGNAEARAGLVREVAAAEERAAWAVLRDMAGEGVVG